MALYISYPYVMKLVAEARKELKKEYDEYDYEDDKSVKDRARGLHALRELGRELQKRGEDKRECMSTQDRDRQRMKLKDLDTAIRDSGYPSYKPENAAWGIMANDMPITMYKTRAEAKNMAEQYRRASNAFKLHPRVTFHKILILREEDADAKTD
jgi:hypothetical protein